MLAPGLSWDWATHEYAARQICDYIGCGDCLPDMLNGSIAPDRDFRDFVNHHCYDPLWECPEGDWVCPDQFDCPALEKSGEWLERSGQDSGCARFYDIGVASHYYLDSRVFWHRVSNEDESCHSRFESRVGDSVTGNFSVTECGVTVSKAELDEHVAEFKNKLAQGPDYSWAVLVAVAVIMVLAAIFRK